MDEPIRGPEFGVGVLGGAMIASALWAIVAMYAYGLGNRELEAYRYRVEAHLAEDARGQAMYDRCVARLAVYEPTACAVSP